jgi:hypothetical protein
MNDASGILVQDHIKIIDPETKKVILSKRG